LDIGSFRDLMGSTYLNNSPDQRLGKSLLKKIKRSESFKTKKMDVQELLKPFDKEKNK